MDASGILILLGQPYSRLLGRLQILALQTLINCSREIIYAALVNLLEPDLNSWHSRECISKICSVEIDWVSGIGVSYWEMILDLSRIHHTVNWSLEPAEE